jgi:hypothetical protein
MIPEHQRHGGEADLRRAGRRISERGQRIPVPGPAARGFTRRQPDVLAARHVVIAKLIRGLGDPADLLD